jgi:hypothetical protein
MRSRLCNAEDEEKLLEKVQDVAIVEDPSKTTSSDGVHAAGVFEVDESTKHLRDRLKYAGDDELLNEDMKDDTEVMLNELSVVKKEDVEVKHDDNLPSDDTKGCEEIKKKNSTAKENNGHGSLVRDFEAKGIGGDEEDILI